MKRYKLKKDLPAFKAGTECYIEEAGNMVPCRGVSYTIVHKDQLEQNPDIIDDWFEEIEEPTRWKPEFGYKYYLSDSNGSIYDSFWSNDSADRSRFEIGNCFQTEEEIERGIEYLKALAVVRGDATSKFTKGCRNWRVYYDSVYKYLAIESNFSDINNGIFGLPYFATEEDAQRSIELHRNEWLIIFGVNEEG